jgi:hypothetical protein
VKRNEMPIVLARPCVDAIVAISGLDGARAIGGRGRSQDEGRSQGALLHS